MNTLIWKILLIIQPFVGNLLITAFGGNFSNNEWYKNLNQSPLTPPNIVFPITWSILYLLLGISAVLVYNVFLQLKRPSLFKKLFLLEYLTPYEIQIALNFAWSIVFFGLQKPKISLIIVFAMIGLTAYLLYKSWGISRLAFWLLLPYGLWITFAMYLNFYIVIHNKV